MLRGELRVALRRIAADADDRRPGGDEVLVGVAEGAGFLGADGGVVLGVEEEDDGVVGPEIGEGDARAVVSERELRVVGGESVSVLTDGVQSRGSNSQASWQRVTRFALRHTTCSGA